MMKFKIYSITVLSVATILFSSCKKEYECICTTTKTSSSFQVDPDTGEFGYVTTTTTTTDSQIYESKKKHAEEYCDDIERRVDNRSCRYREVIE